MNCEYCKNTKDCQKIVSADFYCDKFIDETRLTEGDKVYYINSALLTVTECVVDIISYRLSAMIISEVGTTITYSVSTCELGHTLFKDKDSAVQRVKEIFHSNHCI